MNHIKKITFLEIKKTLTDLSLTELRKISKRIDKEAFNHIAIKNSMDRKNTYGGTAKKQVRTQILRLNKKLKKKRR